MSAYFIFTREKTLDQAEMDLYNQQVKATFAGHDIKFLAPTASSKMWKAGQAKLRSSPNSPPWKPPKPGTTARPIAKCASTGSTAPSTAQHWFRESSRGVRWNPKYFSAYHRTVT